MLHFFWTSARRGPLFAKAVGFEAQDQPRPTIRNILHLALVIFSILELVDYQSADESGTVMYMTLGS